MLQHMATVVVVVVMPLTMDSSLMESIDRTVTWK